jgi:hypothetical protein
MSDDPTEDRTQFDPSVQLPILVAVTCGICGKRYDIDLTVFGSEYAARHGEAIVSYKPHCAECNEKRRASWKFARPRQSRRR